MGAPLPFYLVAEVIRLHFEGCNRDENAEESGVSGGKVSDSIKQFKRDVRIMGLEEAAENYKVEDLLEELYELSKELRENGVTLGEAMSGARVAKTLKTVGVGEEDVESFTKKLVKQQTKYPPEEIVRHAEQLHDLEQEYKLKYGELISAFKAKAEEFRQLSDQINGLRKQRRQLDVDLDASMKEKDITIVELKAYVEARGVLKGCGVNIDDLPAVARIVLNMKEQGLDMVRMTQVLSKEGSLSRRISEAESKLTALESKKAPLEALAQSYAQLTSYGFTETNLKALAEIAAKSKTPANFISEIAQAFEAYGGILGMRGELAHLASEANAIKDSMVAKEAESKLSLAAIASMENLVRHGIKEKEVVLIDQVTKQYGTTEETLEAMSRLMKLDNLQLLNEHEQAKLSELKKEVTELEQRREALTSRINAIIDSLERLPQVLAKAEEAVVGTQKAYIAKGDEMVKNALEAGRLIQEIVHRYEAKELMIKLSVFMERPAEAERAFVKPFTLDYLEKMDKWAVTAKGVSSLYGLQGAIKEFRASVVRDA